MGWRFRHPFKVMCCARLETSVLPPPLPLFSFPHPFPWAGRSQADMPGTLRSFHFPVNGEWFEYPALSQPVSRGQCLSLSLSTALSLSTT